MQHGIPIVERRTAAGVHQAVGAVLFGDPQDGAVPAGAHRATAGRQARRPAAALAARRQQAHHQAARHLAV